MRKSIYITLLFLNLLSFLFIAGFIAFIVMLIDAGSDGSTVNTVTGYIYSYHGIDLSSSDIDLIENNSSISRKPTYAVKLYIRNNRINQQIMEPTYNWRTSQCVDETFLEGILLEGISLPDYFPLAKEMINLGSITYVYYSIQGNDKHTSLAFYYPDEAILFYFLT